MNDSGQERRNKYVSAIFCGDDGNVGEAALHLVMAVADAEQAELQTEVERLRNLAARIITVHEQVVMDTPRDRDLHDRACATFRAALAGTR